MLHVENSVTIIITLISTIKENMSCHTYIITCYLLGIFLKNASNKA